MDADGDLVDTLNLYYGCSVVAFTYKCIQHKKFVNCGKNKKKRKNFLSFFFHLSDSLVNLFILVRFDTVYYYIIN